MKGKTNSSDILLCYSALDCLVTALLLGILPEREAIEARYVVVSSKLVPDAYHKELGVNTEVKS